jgi:hypothetical protein
MQGGEERGPIRIECAPKHSRVPVQVREVTLKLLHLPGPLFPTNQRLVPPLLRLKTSWQSSGGLPP